MSQKPAFRFPSDPSLPVPFERGASHLIIPVTDGEGNELRFIFDTGAGVTVITERYRSMARSLIRLGKSDGAASGSHGVVTKEPDFYEIPYLRAGDLRIEGTKTAHVDLPALESQIGGEIHGMLGFNVLSRMVTVIDYSAQEMTFLEPAAAWATLGQADHTIPFELSHGCLIEVVGSVNDRPEMPFIFDTGSPWTFLNRHGADGSGVVFEREPGGAACGSCDESEAATAIETGRARSLAFGTLDLAEPLIRAIDLPVFATLGWGDTAAGLLGNDVFSRARLAIDYARSRLSVWM